MFDVLFANYLDGYKTLSRSLTEVVWNQWKWLETQRQCHMNMWDVLWDRSLDVVPPPIRKEELAAPTLGKEPASLEEVVRERLRKGLAPPREIYDVKNRDRFDWTRMPDWARWVDPELFAGCSHEG
jgi:hypothetical protein